MPTPDLPSLTTTRLLSLPDGDYFSAEVLSGPEHWYRFATAYKVAADELCAVVAKNDYLRNILVAPILYLYRHSIELHLKSLLKDAGELLDEPQTIPPVHYLRDLWKRVRQLIVRIDQTADGPWLDRAGAIVLDFDSLDPTSFALRYPVDKGGAPALQDGLRVDLQSVKRVMAELEITLEGASSQIDVYMDFKAEQESE